MNHHHHHTEMIVPSTSINTPRNNAAKPLAPPPGLLQLKALSPPKELLPEFTKPSTTTSPTKMSISSKKLEIKRTLGTKSTLPLKRKALDVLCSSSTKAFSSDTTSSKPAIHSRSMNKSTTRSRTTKIKNNSFGCEKKMKEPQSGDLYECILTKRNGGLGLTLACVDDHVQITGLAPDTPAATSGIAVGDTLVAVFGLPVRGLQFSTVISRLKSASRNSVDLKLRRNPCKYFSI
jgi:C-terminal processing protease CtpA/Prc